MIDGSKGIWNGSASVIQEVTDVDVNRIILEFKTKNPKNIRKQILSIYKFIKINKPLLILPVFQVLAEVQTFFSSFKVLFKGFFSGF